MRGEHVATAPPLAPITLFVTGVMVGIRIRIRVVCQQHRRELRCCAKLASLHHSTTSISTSTSTSTSTSASGTSTSRRPREQRGPVMPPVLPERVVVLVLVAARSPCLRGLPVSPLPVSLVSPRPRAHAHVHAHARFVCMMTVTAAQDAHVLFAAQGQPVPLVGVVVQ
jgi:hypothetical protein